MEEEIFEQIYIAINEEANAYEEMLELYEVKKNILIKNDASGLLEVDDKITSEFKRLQTLSKQRILLMKQLGEHVISMSQLIEMLQDTNSGYLKKFEELKVKLNKLSKELTLLENTNVELIKHGLVMSDKILNIITSAFIPQTSGYNKSGRNVGAEDISISSVIEDA